MPFLRKSPIQWSGLALLVGGILIILFGFPLGAGFTLFGLVGLHARQAQKTGCLGVIGFIMAFIGTALFFITEIISMFFPMLKTNPLAALALLESQDSLFYPYVAAISWTAGISIYGYVILGIAIMRADILPRPSGLMLVVGILLLSVSKTTTVYGAVIFGGGLVWIGYLLWRDKFVNTEQAEHIAWLNAIELSAKLVFLCATGISLFVVYESLV